MRSVIRPIFAFLALLLFLPLPASAEVVATTGHVPKLEDEAEIKASLKNLVPMVATLGDDSTLTLYEGLPHPLWERELLATEKKHKKVIERYAFCFYEQPNALSGEDARRLKTLVHDAKSFEEYHGVKRCGGFHPDFALVWKDGETEVELHLCFGCGEAKAYRKDGEVYCELSESGGKELKKILDGYRLQKPAK